jgi:hypothetical protein
MAILVNILNTTPSTLLVPNKPYTFQVSVTNAGASTVTLSDVSPVVTPITAAYVKDDTGNPNETLTITAGSTAYYPFQAVFFGPTESSNSPTTIAFTVSAVVYTSDGQVVSSPELVATVSQASTTEPADAGQFLFQSPNNPANWVFF